MRDTTRTRRDTLGGARDTIPLARDTAVKRDTTAEFRVPIPPGPDSLLQRDSLRMRDSLRAEVPAVVRDTVKAPIASAEAPVIADPSGSFVWDRRDLFSTGALTVQDLLDRVPGVTGFRSGWIAHPIVSGFAGDAGRVRVFLDGIELEEMDPRMGRIWDLSQIPLWALDDIRIERGATEIRIHLRSWRVTRTTPYTRTDVYTGDQATNLYRGLFGRRYQNGEVLQLAGQQFGTNPGQLGESSDQLGVLGRVGWAQGPWSADAFLLRIDRNRGRGFTETLGDTVARVESTRSEAYLRGAWGNAASGPWMQAIASTAKYSYGGTPAGSADAERADTSSSRAQYVLTGGYSRGPWRASFTQRYRTGLRMRVATPSARAGFESRLLTVSLFADGRGLDSIRRFEVSSVLRPTSFLFLSGAVGTERPQILPDTLPAPTFVRAEGGVRLGQTWLSGGFLRRDAVLLDAPTIFSPEILPAIGSQALGAYATVRGRIWKAVYVDAQAMQWSDTTGFYRPRYQTRSELYVSTQLLDRFPSGNFHLLVSAAHEYRSHTLWPLESGVVRVPGYRTLSTLLQFRILSAEVFWNVRNVLAERYAEVPGYVLPRLVNMYGVRWEFWN